MGVLLLGAVPAVAATIDLPRPGAALAQQLALVCNAAVGATPERCKKSSVPGPVVNDEVVLVGLDGAGTPVQVLLEQRLTLTKLGDYVIRERGPARSAVGLLPDSDPPNTKLGAVVFQGFTPGNRRLAARLTLDAGLEGPRLPLAVTVTYDGGRGPVPVGPAGRLSGAGTVRIRLENRTPQPVELPTAGDVAPAAVAGPLDRARAAAARAPGPRLPSTDTLVPARIPVIGAARRTATASVPLRITGTVQVAGAAATVTGPGTSAVPNGAVVAGTLGDGAVELTAEVRGGGALTLDLSVVPALDPRLLKPPRGLPTWSAWARSRPPLAERRAAVDLLVATAATGARASSYSPYLGADLPGSGTTSFRYAFAAADQTAAAGRILRPKPGAIALAAVAALLLMVNAGLIRQRC
ncbi:MAG: hypothetical protein NVSMB55_25020 [Mycobacteriales bacterium]